MSGFRYYVNNWIYGPLALRESCERIGRLGFDGIELVGEPSQFRGAEVKELLDGLGLSAISICGIHPGPSPGELRLLSHPEEAVRMQAVDYVKSCLDLAAEIGARSVLASPSMVGQTTPMVSRDEDLKQAADSLHLAGSYAQTLGLLITVEPINRYEVCLVNSVEEGIALAQAADSDAVRTMGDTFHMQMEERQPIGETLRRFGSRWIQHFHVADNTREAPGRGCLAWGDILGALVDIGYEGGISCELLPRGASPYQVFQGGVQPDRMDEELSLALATLRRAEAQSRASLCI